MARRWWWGVGRGLLVAVVAYFVVGSTVVWTGQWVFRGRAERLLADAERLGRGPGSWGEFLAFQKQWGAWGSYRGTCTAAACDYSVQLKDWTGEVLYPSWLDDWKDPWKYNFPVDYVLWPLLRVSRAKTPWMEVGVQVVKGQATPEVAALFMTAERGLPGNWAFEDGHSGYGLVAGFRARRGGIKTGRTAIPEWPEATPVKHTEVDNFRGCAQCPIFTVFDDKANTLELEPLLKLETSCITRWASCQDDASLMPAAWARYDAEHAVQSAQEKRLAACDYPASFLYQQAENAVLMRVINEGDKDGGFKVRYEKRLKGPVELVPGAAYTVWEMGEGPVRSGRAKMDEEMVVLFARRFSPGAGAGLELDAYRCGMMPANTLGAGAISK